MHFTKYQGTGNDFVMIDDRDESFDINNISLVQKLCDRKFGIGADGLILLRNHKDLDFHMIYFNADGSQSFCGNGSRCAVMFAMQIGVIEGNNTRFLSTDGEHFAEIDKNGFVALHMHDVLRIKELGLDNYELNTGSPHYVRYVDDLRKEDILKTGKSVRYQPTYTEEGINVNLVQVLNEASIQMMTYERGVEDETLSCGTGVTAAALVFGHKKKRDGEVDVTTKGGQLKVRFTRTDADTFENIFLIGPAEKVFEGKW